MDKVKEITYQVFVKQLFWTLSVVIILLAVASWWMAAGQMKSDYASNLSEIQSKHTKVDQVVSKPATERVNEHSKQGMQAKLTQRKEDVYVAWVKQYRKQREVLQWPDGLSQEFIDRVNEILQNRPIEERVKFDDEKPDPMVSRLREHYRNEVKSLLPSLAETINANWEPGEIRTRDGLGGRGEVAFGRPPAGLDRGPSEDESATGPPPAVLWSPSNQTEIVAQHFDWQSMPSETPSTLQILYAQEDFQVFKALMQIIARTNTDPKTGQLADQPHEAAINQIESIQIGLLATRPIQSITRMEGAEPVEGGEGSLPALEGGPAAPSSELYSGEGPSVALSGEDPAEGRYVDKSYLPLPAETLRTAAESEKQEEAYLAVAKRVPVLMRLTIDQRHLNRFLVECGNADLMLEIKQVSFYADSSASEQGGSRGGRGGLQSGPRRGEESSSGSSAGESQWDVEVEVYGLIYIFNPPSLKRLGLTLEVTAEIRKKTGLEDDVSDAIVPESPEASDEESDEDGEDETDPPAAAAIYLEAATVEGTG